MAQVDDNDVTLGLRGRFGKQFVFRKMGKKTIAVRRTKSNPTSTAEQAEHRELFKLAALYAKKCLLIPALKDEYAAIARANDLNSAFAAAVGDYLNPVTITSVVTEMYKGEIGYPLGILVSDAYKVKTMTVSFLDATGAVIESGNATISQGAVGFNYITTVAIPDIAGVKIRVEVKDRPGNTVVHEVTL